MMLNRLDLSDAQRDRVREITTSHRDEQRALDERARTSHQALDAAIIASPLDEAAIRGKAADIAQVDADIAVARGRIYNEVLQVLTSDQQQKLTELRTERRERMERRQQERSERRQNRSERRQR
jgi:Spy/CpxP family protein refolding chaperone